MFGPLMGVLCLPQDRPSLCPGRGSDAMTDNQGTCHARLAICSFRTRKVWGGIPTAPLWTGVTWGRQGVEQVARCSLWGARTGQVPDTAAGRGTLGALGSETLRVVVALQVLE